MSDLVPIEDLTWQQGEDGEISMDYTDADDAPVNLTDYNLRMDIVNDTGTKLYTFNTEDADPSVGQTEADEATLGADGSIYIVVPRGESLTGGSLFNQIDVALHYDIFLRTPDPNGKQKKILKGTVTIEKSYTLWA